jgi:hypothetical protein
LKYKQDGVLDKNKKMDNIQKQNVTYRRIARHRLGKNIPAQTYASNDRASTARQWVSKQTFSTTEAMISAWSMQSGYKEVLGGIKQYGTVV